MFETQKDKQAIKDCENDLQIIDKQIAKYKQLIKDCKSETIKYEHEYKVKMLQEMRLDVLIQKQHFEGK